MSEKTFAAFAGHRYYPTGGWYDFSCFYGQLYTAVQAMQELCELDGLDWWHVVDVATGTVVARWHTDIYADAQISFESKEISNG